MQVIGVNMIENYLFEQLIAFANNGTLSKAAQQLHISQPALSKSMQKIEDEIGVPLFERSKSHIQLNETGKVALKYAKLALDANQAVIDQAKRFDEAKRTFTIGACSSIVLDPTIKVIDEYHPTLKIQTQIADDQELITGLLDQQFNIAILHQRQSVPEIITKHYLDERLMLTFNRDCPLAKRSRLHFTDLAGMSILAHQSANFWLDVCQDHIPHVNLLIQEKLSSMRQLFEAAHLPIFNSSLAQQLHEDNGDQVTMPIADKDALASYCIACRKDDYFRLRSMIEAIQSENYFNNN